MITPKLLDKHSFSMLMDFCELFMANGYFDNAGAGEQVYFDMFFRKIPDNGGFAIMAGTEQFAEYIEGLGFSSGDIEYLAGMGNFSPEFLRYLENFRFSGDIWAVPEGTPVFPGEPIVTVRATAVDAQLIETMLLSYVNYQSLVATKANRVVRAASGHEVLEIGSRRAHGPQSALLGARAAYIGGCEATACVLAAQKYDIPLMETMSHAWVQLFDSELEAFRAYARKYPDNCSLIVDTYNVLGSGIPNAIQAFREEVVPRGYRPKSIRIDSGDIAYITKKGRKMLDQAGFLDCRIIASNSLDEYVIRDMLMQGAKADIFGVGERLITAASDPVFPGVYKLCAVERGGRIIPKIKLSENTSKITLPGFKCLWRLFDRDTGKAIADVITLFDEIIDDSREYELFDPEHTWKRKKVGNFVARRLHKQIFKAGECVAEFPQTSEVREYCRAQIDTLWEEVLRFENPHKYYVDYSQRLWDLRHDMIREHS